MPRIGQTTNQKVGDIGLIGNTSAAGTGTDYHVVVDSSGRIQAQAHRLTDGTGARMLVDSDSHGQVDVLSQPNIRAQEATNITFYSAAVKTESENSASQDTSKYRNAMLIVDVTAVSGTTPTLVIQVQTSPDGTNWYHNSMVTDKDREGSLTRLTAPTDEAKITTVSSHICWCKDLSKYTRLALTITGTTPSFTVSAVMTPYA